MAGIQGFDISIHNSEAHPIDWTKVPLDKARFVLIKATEGATYEDPWFDRHWTAAHSKGLVCGAYHFYRSNKTGKEQADNIIKNIITDAAFGKGDLPVAIDVEELKSVETQANSAASINAFLKELGVCFKAVEDKTGAKPILYTAGYVWQALRNPADFVDYPLWIARPTTAATPTLPAPFQTWTFWQYSFKGKLPGVTGDLDLDRFNGADADFQKLLLR